MTATTLDPWGDPAYVPSRARTVPAPAPIAWVDRRAQAREEAPLAAAIAPAAPRETETEAFVRRHHEVRRQARADRRRDRARFAGGLLLAAGVAVGALFCYAHLIAPALMPVLDGAESTVRDATARAALCSVITDVNQSQVESAAARDARLQAAGVLEPGEALTTFDTSRADALCGDD